MAEDEWVKAAMGDDSMVVELLIRIKHSEPASVPNIQKMPSTMTILEWGLRQPRSRQILRCSNNNNTNTFQMQKKGGGGGGGESTRASPTTPLSWSGGTSFSGGCEDGGGIGIGGGGGGDGYEEDESSRPVKRPSGGGSNNKVTGPNERIIRRSRKKKTFAQLKEEESLLLKERIHLKKELATLRHTCEEQKDINNKLKRMKLDCQSQSSTQPSRAGDVSKEGVYDQSCHMENNPSTIILPPSTSTFNGMDDSAICSSSLPTDLCIEQQMDTVVVRESLFELPDLNLPLEEEDSSTEVLYGMS